MSKIDSSRLLIEARSYRPDIDGLRALAIIPVVLFHAGGSLIPGGFAGVDMFFVISGFLIGSHVHLEMTTRRFSLGKFYAARAKRILPALLLVVGFFYIPAVLLLSGQELKDYALEAMSSLTSSSNILFTVTKSNYFASAAGLDPLLMTWSLGVEEQFYIAFPFLLALIIKLSPGREIWPLAAMSAVSFLLAVYLSVHFPTPAFYLLPTRAWELGIGVAGGILITDGRYKPRALQHRAALECVSIAAALLLLWTLVGIHAAAGFPGIPALAPCFATLFFLGTQSSWLNQRVLASKPLVWIGRVSYSWYLWHWPLMSFARISMAGTLSLRIGLAIALLSFLLAIATYFAVEQPFRRSKVSVKPLLSRYAAALAACCIPAFLLCLANGWPTRYPSAQRIDASMHNAATDVCLSSYRQITPRNDVPCISSDNAVPRLAVMGDSHAAALAPFLRSQATQAGWAVDDFTKTSCPQLGLITRNIPARPTHASECATFNRRALQLVLSTPEIHAVLLAGFWSAPFGEESAGEKFVNAGADPTTVDAAHSWQNLRIGVEEVVTELKAKGKRVFLMVDVPRFQVDPPSALRTNAIPLRLALNNLLGGSDLTKGSEAEDIAISAADRKTSDILQDVALKTGATLINPTNTLCDGATCTYEVKGEPLYGDQQHLTQLGAKYALSSAALFTAGKIQDLQASP